MQRDSLASYFASVCQLLLRLEGRNILELGSARTAQPQEEDSRWWFAKHDFVVTSVSHDRTSDALEYLQAHREAIDLLYLNAWQLGQAGYKKAYLLAQATLHARSLIVVNDTDLQHGGNAELLVATAEEEGWRVVYSGRQTLLAAPEAYARLRDAGELAVPREESLSIEEAVQLQRRGLTWQAERVYQHLLIHDPDNARALHLLGVTHLQRQQFATALLSLQRAVQLVPQSAIFLNNYGAALQGLGRIAEACEQFERAVAIKPDYVDAIGNLACAWQLLGAREDAERLYRQAMQLDPLHLPTIDRYSQWLTQIGRRDVALRILQEALQALPQSAALAADYADVLLLDQRLEAAVEAYRRALALQPDQPRLHFNLGTTLGELEQVEEARQHLRTACQHRPAKHAWRLREMLLCPTVFPSEVAIDEYQAALAEQLDALIADPPSVLPQDLMHVGFHPPFPLSFQGREHRPLKEKFATLCRQWIKPLHIVPKAVKPRVGFVVTRGHEGGFIRGMAGVLEGMDPQQLDMIVLCAQSNEAVLRNHLKAPHLKWGVFADEVTSAVATIARAGCHVLYHWEIGTDGLNYQLPFYRLAPVQVTSWGTQVTTGIREIDYYLSSRLIEAPHSASHFTEQLHLFETLPTYQRRVKVVPRPSRAEFGLPEDRPVYLCPQTILKLHPQQDALFAAVLAADPRGVLAIKEGKLPQPNQVLKLRMQQTLGADYQRVVFIPWQATRDEYYGLIQVADVILDTHHFSAGSTTYDLFTYHEPVVTWPGTWNVSRYTAACYRRMQLTALTASSLEEYAQIAVHVANDQQYQQQMREQLQARDHLIFDDSQAVAEHQAFFLAAASRA
jgi:protein O-GlcNAc transferase